MTAMETLSLSPVAIAMDARQQIWLDSLDLTPDQFDFRGMDNIDWHGA
jgi:hypothetical protein